MQPLCVKDPPGIRRNTEFPDEMKKGFPAEVPAFPCSSDKADPGMSQSGKIGQRLADCSGKIRCDVVEIFP